MTRKTEYQLFEEIATNTKLTSWTLALLVGIIIGIVLGGYIVWTYAV